MLAKFIELFRPKHQVDYRLTIMSVFTDEVEVDLEKTTYYDIISSSEKIKSLIHVIVHDTIYDNDRLPPAITDMVLTVIGIAKYGDDFNKIVDFVFNTKPITLQHTVHASTWYHIERYSDSLLSYTRKSTSDQQKKFEDVYLHTVDILNLLDAVFASEYFTWDRGKASIV